MERLLDKLMNPDGSRIWILNRKYCPHKAMLDGEATVVYSYDPVGTETPFSLDTISNITTRRIFNLKRKNEKSCLIMMLQSKESLPSGTTTRT